MSIEIRRDERGRPVGLAWPEQPPVAPDLVPKVAFTGTPNLNGRPREELCGAGLHDMAEHGREIKNGSKGRYCNACKNIRARKYRAERKARNGN